MSEFKKIPVSRNEILISNLYDEIKKGLNLSNLYSKLIRVLYQEKQFKKALEVAEKAISLGLNPIKLVKMYSKLLIVNEEYEKVVSYLEEFLEKQFDYNILSILSNAYYQISKINYFTELSEKKLSEAIMRGRVGNYWMESNLDPEAGPVKFSQLNVSYIAATKARMLYVLKNNPRNINTVPKLTEKLDFRHPIKQVSCGLHFYMVLDSIGRVFAWGNEQSCHIGFNTSTLQYKSISAGYEHCAAISVDDQLYTWGRSSFGKLGLGSTGDVNIKTPSLVVGISRKALSKVSCFGMNTSVLTTDGQMFTFGRNHRNQIGCENAEFPEVNPLPYHSSDPITKPVIIVPPTNINIEIGKLYNNNVFSDLKIETEDGEILSLHCCMLSLTKDLAEFFSNELKEKPKDQPYLKYKSNEFFAKVHHATHKTHFKLSESEFLIQQLGITKKSVKTIFEYFYAFPTESNFYISSELQGIFNLPDLEGGNTPKPYNFYAHICNKSPEISDCKIKTKDGIIFAHKTLLSRSHYFRKIFSNGFKESQTSEISINERNNVVSSFINYIYVDKLPLPKDCTGDDLLTLLDMANIYELPRLTALLEKLISISLDLENAIPLLNYARDRNANQLVVFITDFIRTYLTHFTDSELEKLPREVFTQVKNHNLNVDQLQVGGQYTPRRVLSDKNIIDIAQGEKFTIALDSNCNTIYQLGYGSSKTKNISTTFNFDSKIVKISVGSSHAVVLDEKGELYGWGCGFLGQVGNKKTFYTVPTKLESNPLHDSIATGTWSTFSWLGSQTTLLSSPPSDEKEVKCPFFRENQSNNIDPWEALANDPTADVTIHIYSYNRNDSELVNMMTTLTLSDTSSDDKSESSVASKKSTDDNKNIDNSFEVLKVHSLVLPQNYLKQFQQSPSKPIKIFGFTTNSVKKLFEYQYTRAIHVDGEHVLNLMVLAQISGSYMSSQLMTYIRETCNPSLAITLLKTLHSTSNIVRLPYLSKFLIAYLAIHKSQSIKVDEFYSLPSELLSQI